MSQNVNESLSAMMDGEANELETRRVLKQATPEDLDTWSRYQTVSSLLKQDKDLFLGGDIASAVAAAIEHEDTPKVGLSTAMKSGLSFAAAACVTLAVFASLQFNTGAEGLQPAVPTVAETNSSGPVFAGGQGLSLQADQGFATVSGQLESQSQVLINERALADAIAADRLEEHIDAHAEQSSLNSNEGVLPLIRAEAE